jgi:hypothetical protein
MMKIMGDQQHGRANALLEPVVKADEIEWVK